MLGVFHDDPAEAHHPDQFQTCYTSSGELDADCDGFSIEREVLTGTDPGVKCSATSARSDYPANREIDAWPPDANNDQTISLGDIGVVIGNWGHGNTGPGTSYYSRGDVNGDGTTCLSDLGTITYYWGQNCNGARGASTHVANFAFRACDDYFCYWISATGAGGSRVNSGWNGWYYFVDQHVETSYGYGIGSTGPFYNWGVNLQPNAR